MKQSKNDESENKKQIRDTLESNEESVIEDEFMKNYYKQNAKKIEKKLLTIENSKNLNSKSKTQSESELYFEEYDLKHGKDDTFLNNQQEKQFEMQKHNINNYLNNENNNYDTLKDLETSRKIAKNSNLKYTKSKTEIKRYDINCENENQRNTLCLDLVNSNSFQQPDNFHDNFDNFERIDLSIGTIKKKENNFLFSDSQTSVISKKVKNKNEKNKKKKNIVDNYVLSAFIENKKSFKDKKDVEVIKNTDNYKENIKNISSYSDISNSSSLYEETCSVNSSLNRKSLSVDFKEQLHNLENNINSDKKTNIQSRKGTNKKNIKKKSDVNLNTNSNRKLSGNNKRINKSLKNLLDNISSNNNKIKISNENKDSNRIENEYKELRYNYNADLLTKQNKETKKNSLLGNQKKIVSSSTKKDIKLEENLPNIKKNSKEDTNDNEKSEYFDQDVFKEKVTINMDHINNQIDASKKKFNKAIKKINNGLENFEVDNYFDENTNFNNDLRENLLIKPHPLSDKYHKQNGKFFEVIKPRNSSNNINENVINPSPYMSTKELPTKNQNLNNASVNSQVQVNNNDFEFSNNSDSSMFINQCNFHRKMMNESTNAREVMIIKDKLNNLKKNYYNQKILKKSYILKVIIGFLIFLSFVLILFRLYSRNYDDIIEYQNKHKKEINSINNDFLSLNNSNIVGNSSQTKNENSNIIFKNESITNIPIILSNFLFLVDFLNAIINVNGIYSLESLKINRINIYQKCLLFLFCLDISVVLIMIFVTSNSVLILIAIYFCFSSCIGYLFLKTSDVLSLIKKRLSVSTT